MKDRLIYFLIFISLVLLLLDYSGSLLPVKSALDNIIMPVKQTLFTAVSDFGSLRKVLSQYRQFYRMYDDLKVAAKKNEEFNLQIKLLTEENKKLRIQLDAPLPPSYKYIPASVISNSRYLEVAAGIREGVVKNMPVVDGLVLLGRITTVSEKRSSIMLLTDNEMQIAVKTSRGAKGILAGQAGKSLLLDKVLQKEALFLDDQVVTSGEDGLPPNLIIGRVTYIITTDEAVYKQAKVETLIDALSEKTVFIISAT